MPALKSRLRCKRVYEPVDKNDGTRVLVDRLWPRGLSKERAAIDVWLKDIAPSTTLRKWLHADLARWTVFGKKYRAELDGNAESVTQLRALAKKGRITLLYAVQDTERNHAVILAAYLQKRRAS